MSHPSLLVVLRDGAQYDLPMQSSWRFGNGFRMDFGVLPDAGECSRCIVRRELREDSRRMVAFCDRYIELPANWAGRLLWDREQNQGQSSDDFEVFWDKVRGAQVTEQVTLIVKEKDAVDATLPS